MRYGRALTVAILLGLVVSGCSKEDPQAFSKVDYNKDGKIIFEELIVAFPDMTVEEFLAADADRNGSLDAKEYQRLREARASGKKLDASSAPAAPAAPAGEPKAAAPQQPAPAKPAEAPKPAEQPKAEATPAAPASAPAPAPAATPPAATPAPAASAKPAEEPKPAAPQQPAPAKPAEAPKPAEQPKAEAAPPAPATGAVSVEVQSTPGTTYTVGRGDTLTRIARKFNVSAKAIMDANNIKNADHLEAGATLTIPSGDGGQSAAPAVPPAVADIVAGYFTRNASGDINGLMDYYADKVDYYKKGRSGKDIVRQDKAAYFARWPERRYEPGKASVQKLKNGELRVTVPSGFAVKKDDKGVQGKAVFTFLLRPSGDTYRIVGEQSRVTEKK